MLKMRPIAKRTTAKRTTAKRRLQKERPPKKRPPKKRLALPMRIHDARLMRTTYSLHALLRAQTGRVAS
jgi:hypothetical protein